MQIFLSYPWWFTSFCFILAVIYTLLLYFNQKQAETIQKKTIIILSVLRFICSFSIAFLLLSPFVKRHFVKTEKPIIIIAQDASNSIKYCFDKLDSNQYFNNLASLEKSLANSFEVVAYTFDDELHNSFSKKLSGQTTNLSKTLDDINDIYYNRNVGAIILASDGIYNRGINPNYSEVSNLYPIYTVLLGDTNYRKDAKIQKTLNNDIVYMGDQFEVKVDIASYHCEPNNASISIERIGDKGSKSILANTSVSYKSSSELQTISFKINATVPGVNHFRIIHSAIKGEFTYENNYKDIYVQVLDGKDKILLVADAPHPDISALKQAIEKNKNYTLDITYLQKDIPKLDDYNVVILYQVPSTSNHANTLLNDLKLKNISTWYILGSNSDLQDFSKIQNIVEVSKIKYSYNDVHAIANDEFSFFSIDKNYLNLLEKLPPLTVPFGDFKSTPSNVVLNQKIGNITTNYPLLIIGEGLQQKQAVLMGEGLWKWRMYNYVLLKNHDAVDDLIQKTVQYLSIKGDKRKFVTHLSKNIYNENENVFLTAQLYNDNYQMINTSDVFLTVYDEMGHTFSYTFSKNTNAYELDLGKLKNGLYSYTANTKLNNKTYKDEGKFIVKGLQLEAIETRSNNELLYNLAKKKGGQMVYANDILQLEKILKAQKDIKPILFDSYKIDSIINIKILFFLILFLLSVEWIVRKYLGLY